MVVHVNERLHALLLSYYFYSIYKHILRHDGGALGEQDWACSLIENDMIVRIHIQIKKLLNRNISISEKGVVYSISVSDYIWFGKS